MSFLEKLHPNHLHPLPERLELAQTERLLRSMPKRHCFRYMNKPPWEQWSCQFLDHYGSCSEVEQGNIAFYLTQNLPLSENNQPQTQWLTEILLDFGQNSQYYDQTSALFLKILNLYHQHLDQDQFTSLVIVPLHNSSIIPKDIKAQYNHLPHLPSDAIRNRAQTLAWDAALERSLIMEQQIPEDVDTMIYALKKITNDKMGLPEYLNFLTLVEQKFTHHEEWPQIKEQLSKLKKKHQDWYHSQEQALQSQVKPES